MRNCLLLLTVLWLIWADAAWARKWTSSDGKFSVEADLVAHKDGVVQLLKENGKVLKVPVSKLSKADQQFLAAAASKKEPSLAAMNAAIKALTALGAEVFGDPKAKTVEVTFPKNDSVPQARFKAITDDVLAQLKGMNVFLTLDLKGSVITDAGLAHLVGLTDLEELDLDSLKVTDAGLAHLKGMTNLRTLYLGHTQVTDKGLAHLAGLKNLEFLDLNKTSVTGEAIEKLKEALPDCEVGEP
jgi:hypothetical protein